MCGRKKLVKKKVQTLKNKLNGGGREAGGRVKCCYQKKSAKQAVFILSHEIYRNDSREKKTFFLFFRVMLVSLFRDDNNILSTVKENYN